MHQQIRLHNIAYLEYAGYINGTPLLLFDVGDKTPMWVMPTAEQFEYLKNLSAGCKRN